MTTLLEKAKQVKTYTKKGKDCSNEEVELAIAWIKDEVTYKQIFTVLGLRSGAEVYVILAQCLREAYKRNKIQITE